MSAFLRIAVVTPYYKEKDDVLQTCLASVVDQEYKNCCHFVIADGFPNAIVKKFRCRHIVLPSAHADNGNAARCIGAIAAVTEGFDAVAFLDADNWYRADHISRLVDLHQETGASVCTSGRTMHVSMVPCWALTVSLAMGISSLTPAHFASSDQHLICFPSGVQCLLFLALCVTR
jgi:glycosyltransferase involved in cell wall biosynthesis